MLVTLEIADIPIHGRIVVGVFLDNWRHEIQHRQAREVRG